MSDLEEKLFDTLDGAVVDFYGVDNHVFCIGINGHKAAFEVLEDPSDGYRSYLKTIEVAPIDHIFFATPIAVVLITKSQHVWEFVDTQDSRHVWLTFGTANADYFYPVFRL
jgi:hypothetical protein